MISLSKSKLVTNSPKQRLAKEVIEIRLLSKEYMYIHRLTLIKFRRIYFLNKLLLTKNYLSNFKRKALKEGKPYKEPGVYLVHGRGKRGPYLESKYRCKRHHWFGVYDNDGKITTSCFVTATF